MGQSLHPERRPVIGVLCCNEVADRPVQVVASRFVEPLTRLADATVLLVPAMPDTADVATLSAILDGLLLIFIFVELLYAVRVSLRSHEIVVEPFLIVGILAAIKEIVVLSVEAAALLNMGPEFSRAAVEIGVLGGVVLVLSLSAWVMRVRTSEGGSQVED